MPKIPIKLVREKVSVMVESWFKDDNWKSDVEDYKQDIEDLYSDIMTGVIRKPEKRIPLEAIPWKTNKDVYISMANNAMRTLVDDKVFMGKIAKIIGPNGHPEYSLLKSFETYWATELGWKNKKGKTSKTIDWKSTIRKTVSFNKVSLWDAKLLDEKKNNDNPDYEPELAL